jgi:hypothetical protein
MGANRQTVAVHRPGNRARTGSFLRAKMSESLKIFLDYENQEISSVRLADANELAEMIKSGVLATEVIETVKVRPGRVTILLRKHPVANLVIRLVKDVTQKWMKRRGHRQVRVKLEDVEVEIRFPT